MDQLLSVLKLPKEALFSTLGRTAARALESVWAGNTLQYFFDRLMRNLKSGDTATANVTLWEPDTWPTSAKGVGFSEAPRGALGHWIKIEIRKSTAISVWYRQPGMPGHVTIKVKLARTKRR